MGQCAFTCCFPLCSFCGMLTACQCSETQHRRRMRNRQRPWYSDLKNQELFIGIMFTAIGWYLFAVMTSKCGGLNLSGEGKCWSEEKKSNFSTGLLAAVLCGLGMPMLLHSLISRCRYCCGRRDRGYSALENGLLANDTSFVYFPCSNCGVTLGLPRSYAQTPFVKCGGCHVIVPIQLPVESQYKAIPVDTAASSAPTKSI